jgi:rod shape-determining protein MreD
VRRAAWVALAIALALSLQTTLAPYVVNRFAVDLVLVVVVFTALSAGPVTGLLTGTVAGLAQDALSHGVLGVSGFAKTLVGFLAGTFGLQFILAQPLPRFIVFVAATIVHAACFLGLYAMLDPEGFVVPYGALLSQALANGIVGVLAFQIVELLPGAVQNRRAGRAFKRKHYG